MVGINQVLKRSIVSKDIDNRTKLDALRLIHDCNKYKMELTTNGVVITDAIKYVTQKTEQLDTLQRIDERIEEAARTEEDQTTTNGVF